MEKIEGKLYAPFLKTRKTPIVTSGFKVEYKIEEEWQRWDATVNKIRIGKGYPVKTFRKLVEETAMVAVNNQAFEMFYRGQSNDYKDSQGSFYQHNTPKTVIYPSICRPNKHPNGTYKASIRKTQIIKRYEDLDKMKSLFNQRFHKLDEYYYSLFQHYDTLPTPLIDITQSLRVAATFALAESPTGFLYVFGLPFPHSGISHFIDSKIVLVKLQNISPVAAYRPRYQEGYMVGKYPFQATKEGGDNLARRLVAKFLLDNKSGEFWDKDFAPMPDSVLYPKDDKFEELLGNAKEQFENL